MTNAMEFKPDTRLWSNRARNLNPYVPGEQPKHDNLCKLNTNENPFPPSPKVAEAIGKVLVDQAQALRLYPAPESDDLRQALADAYGLTVNQVFVGNGSDEVLALVFASFFMKERPLLAPDISYSFYPVYADTFGIELANIPLRDDFSIETNDYRQPCSGIIIANPNAPTGILLSLESIDKLASEHPNVVVVIDEAYIDFAKTEEGAPASAVSLINKHDNLLVTQTFSKSRSLAGLRVGMAFGNPSLIEALTRMKNSFNSYPLDRLAQAGALGSVQDSAYFEQVCEQVIELREQLTAQLTELGFEVLPSQANFVFARPEQGNASEIAQQLREQGIIVRYFSQPRIDEYLRITVGTAEQNQRLITALQQLLD
ncbi:histidinol-phosphate transaminase [Psychrobacter lutiphocae]|uniref:histidinol-phosphate transaminase n=1 Tax=Psychrobacter lutiphocae TaxID=540500 RepID=UPI00035C866E|nr:histidinol-phosphate transaminase [Psychrobacter lutiphocae]